ncbi:hypothetical protein DSO57_1015072, partial [Entomophthora muscae]
ALLFTFRNSLARSQASYSRTRVSFKSLTPNTGILFYFESLFVFNKELGVFACPQLKLFFRTTFPTVA